MAKKKKKIMEPQYSMSATNIKAYNYKVYHMSLLEKVLCFLIAFAAGAAVGYLFYGGIGTDEFGDPTTVTYVLNVLFCGGIGLFAGIKFISMRTEQKIKKQINKLNTQFRDMLEALNTSISAGKNVVDSFKAVYEDLKIQYEEDAYIVNELYIILSGLENNVDLEDLLYDFGQRSGIDDIASFANVFKICYRKGGNIKETIRSTYEILTDKMEIKEDIETVVTSSRTEQNIMVIMPIALIGLIKSMSPEFAANFTTIAGIIATTIGVVLFVVAHVVGKIVLDIKV